MMINFCCNSYVLVEATSITKNYPQCFEKKACLMHLSILLIKIRQAVVIISHQSQLHHIDRNQDKASEIAFSAPSSFLIVVVDAAAPSNLRKRCIHRET